ESLAAELLVEARRERCQLGAARTEERDESDRGRAGQLEAMDAVARPLDAEQDGVRQLVGRVLAEDAGEQAVAVGLAQRQHERRVVSAQVSAPPRGGSAPRRAGRGALRYRPGARAAPTTLRERGRRRGGRPRRP